jgi:hypothetical protein
MMIHILHKMPVYQIRKLTLIIVVLFLALLIVEASNGFDDFSQTIHFVHHLEIDWYLYLYICVCICYILCVCVCVCVKALFY